MESLETRDAVPVKKSRRWIAIILALVGLSLVILVCLGGGVYFFFGWTGSNVETVTQMVSKLTEQPVLNHIAFIGNEGNVWLVSPDGREPRSITSDSKGYRFPTWSPDGRRLAFIGSNEQDDVALYVSPTANSAPTVLFDKADSLPFYLYWSPDSNTITFLTQERSGLALRQVDTANPGMERLLDQGAPFYWVWSPNSEKLLMHVGGSRAFSDEAHISLLDNRAGAERVQLDLAPGRFQAPDWSSDGSYFFYIATDDNGREAIYKANAKSLEQIELIKLRNSASLTLSPDGQHLAYLQIDGNGHPPFGTAYLIDTDGQNRRKLLDSPVGSMYWSPNSSKLALLTITRRDDGSTAKAGGLAAPLPQEVFLRWLIYDVKTEALEVLVSFVPTLAFLQTVPYFDQYHLSLTFWSPDSRYFVYTNEEDEGSGAGAVWVADTTGQEEARQVGEGTLAVWSWR
jgi:Tol biopolymer transport system component